MPIDPTQVSLRRITADTVRDVIRLAVNLDQERFVAPNAVSLAQALFAPEAWYRAIYFKEDVAGFVMLYDESLRAEPPVAPDVGIWRFMIDAKHQGRGIGGAALEQIIEHVRAKERFASLTVSYVPGPGCPEKFYLRYGFLATGKVDEGELVLELPIQRNAA